MDRSRSWIRIVLAVIAVGSCIGCGNSTKKRTFDPKTDVPALTEFINRSIERGGSAQEITDVKVDEVTKVSDSTFRVRVRAQSEFVRTSYVEVKKNVILAKAGWNEELIRKADARLRVLPPADTVDAERINPLSLVKPGFFRNEGVAGDTLDHRGSCVARWRNSRWDFEDWTLEQTISSNRANDTSLDLNNIKMASPPAGSVLVDTTEGKARIKQAVDQMAAFVAAVDKTEAAVLAREDAQWKELLAASKPGQAYQVVIQDAQKNAVKWNCQFVAQENDGAAVRILIHHPTEPLRRRIYQGSLNRAVVRDKGPFQRPHRQPPQIVLRHGGGGPSLFQFYQPEELTIDLEPDGKTPHLDTKFGHGPMKPAASVAFARSEAELWNDLLARLAPGTQWTGNVTNRLGVSEQVVLTVAEAAADGSYLRIMAESSVDPTTTAVFEGYFEQDYVHGWPVLLETRSAVRGESKLVNLFNAAGGKLSLAIDAAGFVGSKGDDVVRLNSTRKLEPWKPRTEVARNLLASGARFNGRVELLVQIDQQTVQQDTADITMVIAETRGSGEYVRVVFHERDNPHQLAVYEGQLFLDNQYVDGYCLELTKKIWGTRNLTLFNHHVPTKVALRLSPDGAKVSGYVFREKGIVIERISLSPLPPDEKAVSLASADFEPLVREKLAKGMVWRGNMRDLALKRTAEVTLRVTESDGNRLSVELTGPKVGKAVYGGSIRLDDAALNGYCAVLTKTEGTTLPPPRPSSRTIVREQQCEMFDPTIGSARKLYLGIALDGGSLLGLSDGPQTTVYTSPAEERHRGQLLTLRPVTITRPSPSGGPPIPLTAPKPAVVAKYDSGIRVPEFRSTDPTGALPESPAAPASEPTTPPTGATSLIATATKQTLRSWTSADGKFKIEAEFVALQDDKVKLKRADGQTIDVPVSGLSAADQDYLKNHAAKKM